MAGKVAASCHHLKTRFARASEAAAAQVYCSPASAIDTLTSVPLLTCQGSPPWRLLASPDKGSVKGGGE